MGFWDLDTEIERRQDLSIREIFDLYGESAFRRLEKETLRASGEEPNLVVATGGGTFCDEENRDWIRSHGVSVWLELQFSEILRRMESDEAEPRPLFENRDQAFELFQSRLGDYAQADMTLTLDGGETPSAVVDQLARRIEELRAGTDTF